MLEFIYSNLDYILYLDEHLQEVVSNYNNGTYLILFLIIFCETGLIVTPFLPGDALLFGVGSIAAMAGSPLNIVFVVLLLIVAGILGDNTNYFVGLKLGAKIYEKNYRLIRRSLIDKTKVFFTKYGNKTIAFARFIPVIRTFAPFVAGIAQMPYAQFLKFSVIGNVFWVSTFCFAGYFFGKIPIVSNNFSLVIVIILIITTLAPIFAIIKQKIANYRNKNSNKIE